MTKLPTLIHTQVTTLNPEVCDVSLGYVRVRFACGGSQIIDEVLLRDPSRLRDMLFNWLAAHIAAVRREDASSPSVSMDATLDDLEKRLATLETRVNRELP